MRTSLDNMPTAINVRFSDRRMLVDLADGRTVGVPFDRYPILREATARQRNGWELAVDGTALRWESIDEDISVEGILRAPEAEIFGRRASKRTSKRTSRRAHSSPNRRLG